MSEPMPTNHRVKSWPEYFSAVKLGNKPFELRRNDRDYKSGDLLTMCEYDPKTDKFSGNEITKRITYVMEGLDTGWAVGEAVPRHGLRAGYAILGLRDL